MTDSNDKISWVIKASLCHALTMIDTGYYILYNHGQSPILNKICFLLVEKLKKRAERWR